MNSIFKRISVRRYLDKEVEQEKLDLLMKAAMASPSAGNQQPWEFYIITNKDMIEELSQTTKYSGCLKNAPVAIVPVYRTEGLMFNDYAHIDMSICCENILLEATELGLGSVWLGIAPLKDRMDAVNKILDLPENLQSFAIIAIGYPNEDRPQQDRYEVSRIHYKK